MNYNPQVSNSRLTVVAVETLLHYHTRPTEHPYHSAPAVKEIRETFVRLGVIEPVRINQSTLVPVEIQDMKPDHTIFHTTARGQAWVEAIKSVICPK